MRSSMDAMIATRARRHPPCRASLVLTCVALLAGCAGFSAPQAASQTIYVLESQRGTSPAQVRRNLVLAVSEPQTRPGFDTPQMVYVQQPHELNYFVASRWADTPARMLSPLLVGAMEQTGRFRARGPAPGPRREPGAATDAG